MVQISTRVLVAALAAAPALAIPLSQSIEDGVATRDFDDAQLEVRNPFIGKIFKGVKSFLGFRRDLEDVETREFADDVIDVEAREFEELVTDLEARNPFIGKIFKGVKSFLGFRRDFEDSEIDAREFDEAVAELEARNPFLGKIFKAAKGFLGFRREFDEIDAREFEELLDARELLDEVDAREFDEFVGDLEARNPFLGKIFKAAKGFLGFRRDSLDAEFEARDFDVEEVDARDFFDYEDFEAREIDELD